MSYRLWGLVILATAMSGCGLLPTRIPADRCESNSDCGGGLICDLNRDRCVCPACLDASATDAGAVDSSSPDGTGDSVPATDCTCSDGASDSRGDRPECVTNADCHDPSKPLCGAGGTCVSCGAAGAPSCASADPAHPACGPLGVCVECTTSSQCTSDTTKPLCGDTGTCVGCGATGASSCASVYPAHPACGAAGACVECTTSSQCTNDATKPLCGDTGTCVGCGATGAPSCASVDAAHPACGPVGACVECTANSQCTAALKPFCAAATNTCVPCSTDDQCTGRGPGVCVASDGHCAADTETIYVAAPAGTCDTAPAGSASHPFCTLHDGAAAVTASRSLLVVRGAVDSGGAALATSASIVGQDGTIAPGTQPGLRVTGASVGVRNITFKSGLGVGLIAELAATVRLDGVVFDSNGQGGLRITGSGFDVVNSLFVANGGVRDTTVGFFGGVYLGTPPVGLPHRFDFNTVVQNKQVGVICEAATQQLNAVLLSGNPPMDSNCIVVSSKTSADGDPMLSPSYRLTAPSTCRNAVTQPPAGAPDHDIDGTTRPQEAKYDCGASEFKP